MAEKDDSKSNPVTTNPNNKIIKDITYIEKTPRQMMQHHFQHF